MTLHAFVFVAHLTSLAVAVVGIMLADKTAFAWLRGKVQTVSHAALFVAHWVVTVGLAGLVLTGLYLFWPERQYLLGQQLFWIKMIFVVALLVNSFFIEELMHTAKNRPFALLTRRQKIPLLVSGAVSTLSWLGAAGAAVLLFGL